MPNVNYANLQAAAKKALQTFNAVPVIVRLSETNTTVSTIGVFVNGTAKNMDNRSNATWVTGETVEQVMVPGIDFINPSTSALTTPQVGGTVEYVFLGVQYKKVITAVDKQEPTPGMAILFTLSIA